MQNKSMTNIIFDYITIDGSSFGEIKNILYLIRKDSCTFNSINTVITSEIFYNNRTIRTLPAIILRDTTTMTTN